MILRPHLRAAVAATLLTAFALVASIQSLRQSLPTLLHNRISIDRITRNERRLAPLRSVLPDHGVVGYVSSVATRQLFSDTVGTAQFYLTQYAVAPVLVVNDPSQALVVANLFRGAATRLTDYPGLVVVQDFGQGVALLQRKEP